MKDIQANESRVTYINDLAHQLGDEGHPDIELISTKQTVRSYYFVVVPLGASYRNFKLCEFVLHRMLSLQRDLLKFLHCSFWHIVGCLTKIVRAAVFAIGCLTFLSALPNLWLFPVISVTILNYYFYKLFYRKWMKHGRGWRCWHWNVRKGWQELSRFTASIGNDIMHRIVKLALANIQAFHPSNFKQIVKMEHSLIKDWKWKVVAMCL